MYAGIDLCARGETRAGGHVCTLEHGVLQSAHVSPEGRWRCANGTPGQFTSARPSFSIRRTICLPPSCTNLLEYAISAISRWYCCYNGHLVSLQNHVYVICTWVCRGACKTLPSPFAWCLARNTGCLTLLAFSPAHAYGSSPVVCLQGILPPDELSALVASKHRPNFVLGMLSELVACLSMPRPERFRMDANITFFHDCHGKCERILKTPIPLSYTR